MELDGSLQFALSTSLIPNAHFNQSRANTYQCAMGKQAVSSDPDSFLAHSIAPRTLLVPNGPFVSTKAGKVDNYGYQSSGVNVCLAMLSEALNKKMR